MTFIFTFTNLTLQRQEVNNVVDFYGDDDYCISSQLICLHGRRRAVLYNIPAEAKIVVIKDFGNGQVWGKFKFVESSKLSSSYIVAGVRCEYASGCFLSHKLSWSKGSKSSGCWEQIQV